jgi:hypothetical protein
MVKVGEKLRLIVEVDAIVELSELQDDLHNLGFVFAGEAVMALA